MKKLLLSCYFTFFSGIYFCFLGCQNTKDRSIAVIETDVSCIEQQDTIIPYLLDGMQFEASEESIVAYRDDHKRRLLYQLDPEHPALLRAKLRVTPDDKTANITR